MRFGRKSIDEPVGDLPAKIGARTRKGFKKTFPPIGRRFPKGTSGNPGGVPRDVREIYRETRRICVNASPEMAEGLIALARTTEDDRVKSVCMIAVLDRAGIRPIDKPEDDGSGKPAFDPRQFNERDLAVIELALRLMLQGGSTDPDSPSEPQILPPEDA